MPKRAPTPAASRRRMLLDAGAALTIVGHSERREAQRESDAEVKAKAEAALACGLDVILCVGESLEVREAGRGRRDRRGAARRVASRTARGSGTCHRLRADLGDRHRQGPDLRRNRRDARRAPRAPGSRLWRRPAQAVRILYGGSVKPSNAGGDFRSRRRRRRAGRRREPEGRRFHARSSLRAAGAGLSAVQLTIRRPVLRY